AFAGQKALAVLNLIEWNFWAVVQMTQHDLLRRDLSQMLPARRRGMAMKTIDKQPDLRPDRVGQLEHQSWREDEFVLKFSPQVIRRHEFQAEAQAVVGQHASDRFDSLDVKVPVFDERQIAGGHDPGA